MSDFLNFNVFNIIIIFGAIQGLIFGLIVLISKNYKSSSNFYLAQVVIYYLWDFRIQRALGREEEAATQETSVKILEV